MPAQDVHLDELDARLLTLLAAEPRIGVLECSRRLGVARGTVQARLDKLVARGAIRGFGPEVSPSVIGFGVTSFVTLEISQRYGHGAVTAHLAQIPEVLEAHTITGAGDLMCRIVARSNPDLQRVIDQIVGYEGILRASSVIALAEQIPYRTMPLVRAAATGPGATSATAAGSSSTGPGSTGPGSTGPGSTGPGSTGPGDNRGERDRHG